MLVCVALIFFAALLHPLGETNSLTPSPVYYHLFVNRVGDKAQALF